MHRYTLSIEAFDEILSSLESFYEKYSKFLTGEEWPVLLEDFLPHHELKALKKDKNRIDFQQNTKTFRIQNLKVTAKNLKSIGAEAYFFNLPNFNLELYDIEFDFNCILFSREFFDVNKHSSQNKLKIFNSSFNDLKLNTNHSEIDIELIHAPKYRLSIASKVDKLNISNCENIQELYIYSQIKEVIFLDHLKLDSLSLQIGGSSPTNIYIKKCKVSSSLIETLGSKNINITESSFTKLTLKGQNSVFQILNSDEVTFLKVVGASELVLNNLKKIKDLCFEKLSFNSFIRVSNITFGDFQPSSSLKFINSFTQSCDFHNILFTNTQIVFENSESNKVNFSSTEWENVRFYSSTSLLELYRNFKNSYSKRNDILNAKYFFELEQKELLRTLIQKLKKDYSLTCFLDILVLSFNKMTGNGFNYFLPLIYISLVTFTFASFKSGNTRLCCMDIPFLIRMPETQDYLQWLLPFQEITRNTDSYIRLFFKILLGIFNSACVFQAIQGFRKFNKKF